MNRRYYSLRTGKNPKGAEIDLKTLKVLFRSVFTQWEEAGYFQEHFGYCCVDAGDVPGKLGSDINATMLFNLRKEMLWPVLSHIDHYTEDDLFDVIEFLHDHTSKPLEGYYHSYSGCGYHYNTFDGASGRKEYRERINQLLETYKSGFEISDIGEIMECAQPGTAPLLAADIPTCDKNISIRVETAISKFRRYRSTLAERRDAIRDLADVLEYLQATDQKYPNQDRRSRLVQSCKQFWNPAPQSTTEDRLRSSNLVELDVLFLSCKHPCVPPHAEKKWA